MIPLYILGLLGRFGPQHGYQIKKLVEEQLADFTQIKLPTIYYHLEKMEASGLVRAETGKEGARPEKTVYSISDRGKEHFLTLLRRQLNMSYRPTFDADAVFYFSDHLETAEILESLERHLTVLRKSLRHIEEHQAQTIEHLPAPMKRSANSIFTHHAVHIQAEITWAEQTIHELQEETDDGENQSD